ncbi:hypothetical protein DFH07DRAFT_974074 [Mycena maculata]|uniref:Uncharacterized protein n=1 Tax=Mycena maculata TaxID=230809 RepID=A0AAD7HAI4_9AGAR|nr:hypothetical protein DFH07DRAFT_974074 [Mycena maculata]
MVDPDPTELNEILCLIGELNVSNGNDSAPRTAPRLPPPPSPAQRSAASAPIAHRSPPEHQNALLAFTMLQRPPKVPFTLRIGSTWLTKSEKAARLADSPPTQRSAGTREAMLCSLAETLVPFALEVEAMVRGVSCSIQQGYSTFEGATAAFEYARLRGWTRRVPDDSFIVPSAVLPPAIPWLPQPPAFSDAPNPLHGEHNGLWYIVYCGITPGVYPSSVECHLNTVGITNSVFDSCDTKEVAILRYQTALADGRIKVLTPIYHS